MRSSVASVMSLASTLSYDARLWRIDDQCHGFFRFRMGPPSTVFAKEGWRDEAGPGGKSSLEVFFSILRKISVRE